MQPSLCYWISKDPNLCPSSPCSVLLNSWACSRTKPLWLLSLSYCSVKTRVDLKNSPCVGGKDPERNLSGAKWAYLKKYSMVSIFLYWREQTLSKGSWSRSPLDTWASRRKHRVDFQGGKSKPHPPSRKNCRAWSWGELVALFGPEQRKTDI